MISIIVALIPWFKWLYLIFVPQCPSWLLSLWAFSCARINVILWICHGNQSLYLCSVNIFHSSLRSPPLSLCTSQLFPLPLNGMVFIRPPLLYYLTVSRVALPHGSIQCQNLVIDRSHIPVLSREALVWSSYSSPMRVFSNSSLTLCRQFKREAKQSLQGAQGDCPAYSCRVTAWVVVVTCSCTVAFDAV